MPGYYLHFAACGGDLLKNRSFVCGVEAPDILKKHLRMCRGDSQKARAMYDALRTGDMPDYSELEARVSQTEKYGSTDGLHYGKSSCTNVRAFWNGLSEIQKNTSFYKGYAWHLLTDAIMYGRLDIDARFRKVLMQKNVIKDNYEYARAHEVEVLHTDWDKTNSLVRATYPEVHLTDEVEALGVVGFIDGGNLTYVDWPLLKETIDYLRTFDPLNDDMNVIIETVLGNICVGR